MKYDIVRDTRRNRMYFTPPPGVSVRGANHDGKRQWIGFASCPSDLAAHIDAMVEQFVIETAAAAAYRNVLAEIPDDYGRRHGAALGGDWSISAADGSSIAAGSEPSMQEALPPLAWIEIARMKERVLLRAETPRGLVYREEFRGYDDYRTTLWLPRNMYEEYLRHEIDRLGITREKAVVWLAESRGCVGTELYEFALTLGVK